MQRSNIEDEQLILANIDSGEPVDARVQHKPFNPNIKYFTLIIDWDEDDAGNYSWWGFAADLEEAEQLARTEMVVALECATVEECEMLDLTEYTGGVLAIYEGACIYKAPLVARRLQELIQAGHPVDTNELLGLLHILRPH